MQLVYEYAESNGIEHRFNKVTRMAGKKWFVDFCLRNNLSLRTAEKMAAARASGFNHEQVDRFFSNLKELYETKTFLPSRIFNMDESGISTVPNKTPKVIAPKGSRSVAKVVTADRGETITIVCCVSPMGFTVPPAIIFPRKRHHPHLYMGVPVGTQELYNGTGYMTSDLFISWLKHFIQYTKPSVEDPVLLTLDNHVSHRSVDAIKICRQNGIHLLSFPPHATQKLQPLDRVYFGPLKTEYGNQCSNFCVGIHQANEVKLIRMENVAQLFKAAYVKTATPKMAETCFRTTGIYPFDPTVFSDDDFAPASVSEREVESGRLVPSEVHYQLDFISDRFFKFHILFQKQLDCPRYKTNCPPC